jgi:GTPase SAR1 family protein
MQTYKVVLVGSVAVGKSSFINRFVKNEYKDYLETTVGY